MRHYVLAPAVLFTAVAVGSIGLRIGVPLYQAHREQAERDRITYEFTHMKTWPEGIVKRADADLAVYRASDRRFVESQTAYDLEAHLDGYKLFFGRKPEGTCIQLQSMRTDHDIIASQRATIIILAKDESIKSVSYYSSTPFDPKKPQGWVGGGQANFVMRLPQEGEGIVIDHYVLPGMGFDKLYPNLRFPTQYQELVKDVLADTKK
jgi:hypothetical protein